MVNQRPTLYYFMSKTIAAYEKTIVASLSIKLFILIKDLKRTRDAQSM